MLLGIGTHPLVLGKFPTKVLHGDSYHNVISLFIAGKGKDIIFTHKINRACKAGKMRLEQTFTNHVSDTCNKNMVKDIYYLQNSTTRKKQ